MTDYEGSMMISIKFPFLLVRGAANRGNDQGFAIHDKYHQVQALASRFSCDNRATLELSHTTQQQAMSA